MKLTHIPAAVTALVAMLLPAGAAAQKHLDNLFESFARQPEHYTVICVEKRNPRTDRVYERREVIQWSGEGTFARLIEAFDLDRKHASGFRQVGDQVYRIDFDLGEGKSESYLLLCYPNIGAWTITRQQLFDTNRP